MIDPEQLQADIVAAFNQRDWHRAIVQSEQLLMRRPEHAAAHYIAGVAQLEMQRLAKALAHLHVATQLAPDRADFHAAYAKGLAIGRLSRQALAAAERALTLSPHDAASLDMLGVAFTLSNAHARAAEVFRRAVKVDSQDAHGHYNLATSLMFVGDLAGAESELEVCIAQQPTFWKAHATLAQLRRQTPLRNHTERVESLLAAHGADSQACELLNFALAKEYEDLGDYARAFDHLKSSKSLMRARSSYEPAHDIALFEALMSMTPADPSAGAGYPTSEPIFVIGMPRSGTTLVERILSSHPDVHSAGELQQFAAAVKRISRSEGGALLDPVTVAAARCMDWHQLGQSYLASTRPLTGQSPRFVDKLPHNFLYAGFIANALPQAKIICLRRNPMDTCLGNFRQMFAETSPFHGYALDLLDTGRYYLLFDRLMQHWQKNFPGRILEVRYEELVHDQEAATWRMLDFCHLPWHDDCLAFETNQAPVATASAVQVRSPIYRTAVNGWKRYEQQLLELRTLLEAGGITIELPLKDPDED